MAEAVAKEKKTPVSDKFLSGGGEAARLMSEKDWTKTSLGDKKTWPQSLKTILSVCLNLKSPALLFWGKELTIFFNDAFRAITPKNSDILGASGKEVWSSSKSLLESVLNEGQSTLFENRLQLLERDGYVQEAYFTYAHSPVYDENGKVGGIFTLVNETTQAILADRRNETLKLLAKKLSVCKTIDEIYEELITTIEQNKRDFTSAILYQIDKEGKRAVSIHDAGFNLGKAIFAQEVDLTVSSQAANNLMKSIQSGSLVYLSDLRSRLVNFPKGAWEKAPEEGVLLPISHFSSAYPMAILAIILNPHQKLDENYLSFFNTIVEQIQSSVTILINIEQEKKLSEAHLQAEVKLNNLFIKAPIAIGIIRGPNHVFELANDKMADLMRTKRNLLLGKPLFEIVKDSAGAPFERILNNVYKTGASFVAEEYEVKNAYSELNRNLFLKFVFEPLLDEKGVVNGIIMIGDDITEYVLNRKKLEDREDQLKIAIEAAELGTYTWESPQPGLIFSDKMANIYGYEGSTNLTQADLQKSSHPDDAQILLDAYEKSKKTGMLKYESRVIWPDKSVHWISVRSKIIFNDQGVPVKLYGTAMDITTLKKNTEFLEQEIEKRTLTLRQINSDLQKSEEKYQKITEEVKDYAIILLSVDGTILNWNKGAAEIKGYKEGEIVGKNFRIFYTDADRKNKLPEKFLRMAIKNGRATIEGYRVKKDGQTFWASTVLTALHDDQQNLIGFSKITRDLTERKQAEDRMQQYTEELEFQNRELEQFAFVASHDLQEPLRVIQMYAQLFEKNEADAETYITKIQLAAKRMQDLIKSVLNYSRLNTTKDKLIKTDLNQIIKNVRSDYDLVITEKKALIISEKLPDIYGIPIQLHQLFSNLISNSLKFSEKSPEISISSNIVQKDYMILHPYLNPSLKYIELKFSDNGIGFNEEYADKIFEVFQRLHDRSEYSGTGIGLALCKKIVANHNGFIYAKSQPGMGSTFYVYLPVRSKA